MTAADKKKKKKKEKEKMAIVSGQWVKYLFLGT